ncbi:MAG: molybdopterin-dependent oxidoreductase, partial [Rhodobacteraceae bacterium]|nr:molybdopterin-dependent oxidoreductase [Paracoccaceae bacterium]
NLAFGGQGTGGSTAMANSFMQYRQAGAAARDMLVRAAAQAWGVDAAAVTIKDGILSTGDRTASIGEFVAQAAKLTPAKEPALKEAVNFKLIGKDRLPRKDSAAKTNSKATFAMDVKVVTYYAGGSFGQRANGKSDYHVEAVLAFVALGGKKAVKLIWTREDDLAGGFYRPMFAQR